jgi:murein DD-endopeptidase MepM/ murein hydrolase activator NlpD
MPFKRFSIQFLAHLLRWSSGGMKFLFGKLGFLGKSFRFVKQGFFMGIVFPLYKVGYHFKYKILNIYAPAKSKVFYILNKSYLIHVVVVIIAFVIFANNINAQELRQDSFGEQTVVYSIITKEEYEELTEVTLVETGVSQVLSYLDQSGSMSAQDSAVGAFPTEEQMLTDLSTVTEGGMAISKPNIIQPITQEEAAQFVQEETKRYGLTDYVVQSGDTISTIAQKFNISVNTILWQNSLGSNGFIKPGQTLEILPTSGVSHKVKSGDTVLALAKKYGIESDKIVEYNNLTDVGDIKISQQLIMPGGKITAPSRRATTSRTVVNVAPVTKLFKNSPAPTDTGGTLFWPAGVRRISQYYNWRHKGLDIAGPTGTPLYSSDPGVVEFSGWLNGYGYNVLVNHQNGIKTRYAHASKLFVSKGEYVTRGQTLAAMGSTGWSTGPHIHYEVIVNGVKKNPLSYIK